MSRGRVEEDFNISDQEYDDPSNKYARKGFTSIEAIQENTFEDGKRSKKRLREQEYTLGAPGSTNMRVLCVAQAFIRGTLWLSKGTFLIRTSCLANSGIVTLPFVSPHHSNDHPDDSDSST